MLFRAAAKGTHVRSLSSSRLQRPATPQSVGTRLDLMNPTTSAQPSGAANVMVPNETEPQLLLRAKGYPYPRPDTSFLFVRGEVLEFDNDQWRGLNHMHEIVGRCGSSAAEFCSSRGLDLVGLSREDLFVPVLAIGSNAGPEQLRRKYPEADFPDCVIPVVQVALEDFDVVYTPYIASYGSCTATLEHSPGTVTSIFITYLTPPLMERMHATEGGYNLCRLTELRLHVAPRGQQDCTGGAATATTAAASAIAPASTGAPAETEDGMAASQLAAAAGAGPSSCFEVLDWVYQYNHKLGCIQMPLRGQEGSPVAIAEIPAIRRAFPAASQVQMLTALKEALENPNSFGPLAPVAMPGSVEDDGLDQWILHMVRDDQARKRACCRLAKCARPFTYPSCEIVAAL
ncbi:hypothetical protein PLESTB_000640700 [Pleodorina starrii]|uniref:Uncharacterized protein n=1 Tax=Pleodorina starrii TaxID=330485 RepID=A0A9W6BIP5_9CHLO|nr:hypothetical protein PLESTM_001301900 [Pleodorina starrii]GLC52538.1 hypothetical protein PLESTB_000640700 [Pleodorina starrii]GLC71538.1 hypothetical protein PLESTF_001132800 [Pleodorina starrii]